MAKPADIIAVSLLRFAAALPLAAARGVGRWLGWLLATIPNRLRDVTHTNLRLSYPELDEEALDRMTRASIAETAIGFFEMGWVWIRPATMTLDRISSVTGEEHMAEAVEAGKGVLLLVPHLGNWEAAGQWLASRYEYTAMYKPSPMPRLNAMILAARTRDGAELVPTDNKGVMALYKRLRKGRIIALLPDQEPDRKGGEFAPLFGIEALSQTLGPRLARETGAAVLGLICLREGDGFRIIFSPALPGIHDEDTRTACTALNQSVERWVAMAPLQYQWEYKRYGKRPPGQPKLYLRR